MRATFRNAGDLAGRVFIAGMFLAAGIGKIAGYAGTQAYMASQGVPGALLPLVIVLEIGVPLLLVAGLWTRASALALAGFTLLATLLFHANVADPMQQILFLKNVAIVGGLLLIAASGAGAWSIDARRAHALPGARRPAFG